MRGIESAAAHRRRPELPKQDGRSAYTPIRSLLQGEKDYQVSGWKSPSPLHEVGPRFPHRTHRLHSTHRHNTHHLERRQSVHAMYQEIPYPHLSLVANKRN